MKPVAIPVKPISELNSREHWGTRQRRTRGERKAAYWAMSSELLKDRAAILEWPRICVTLTRLYRGKQQAMDGDNLQSSMKHVRDGIADWLGVDDGSGRLDWRYEQRRSPFAHVEAALTMGFVTMK